MLPRLLERRLSCWLFRWSGEEYGGDDGIAGVVAAAGGVALEAVEW